MQTRKIPNAAFTLVQSIVCVRALFCNTCRCSNFGSFDDRARMDVSFTNATMCILYINPLLPGVVFFKNFDGNSWTSTFWVADYESDKIFRKCSESFPKKFQQSWKRISNRFLRLYCSAGQVLCFTKYGNFSRKMEHLCAIHAATHEPIEN